MTIPEYAEVILWRAVKPDGTLLSDVVSRRPADMNATEANEALRIAVSAGMERERLAADIRYRPPSGFWLLREREQRGLKIIRRLVICRTSDHAKAVAKRSTAGEIRSIPRLFEIIDPTGHLWARCVYRPGVAQLAWEMA